MGTWRTFDVRTERDVADRRAIVDAALATDTTLFDTSPMYREAERVLARALDGRRERAQVADKVWTSSASAGREQVQRALDPRPIGAGIGAACSIRRPHLRHRNLTGRLRSR